MILLDTNILSAMMQSQPDPAVIAWMDRQPPPSLWTTSVTLFEISLGLALLAEGRRRARLEEAFARAVRSALDNRILPFDEAAATEAAQIAATRQRAERPADFRDTQIAGIAISRRAAIATRNLRHFQGLSIEVIDPWAA